MKKPPLNLSSCQQSTLEAWFNIMVDVRLKAGFSVGDQQTTDKGTLAKRGNKGLCNVKQF